MVAWGIGPRGVREGAFRDITISVPHLLLAFFSLSQTNGWSSVEDLLKIFLGNSVDQIGWDALKMAEGARDVLEVVVEEDTDSLGHVGRFCFVNSTELEPIGEVLD